MPIISFFFLRFFTYPRVQLYSLFPIQTAKRYLCSELFEWIQTWSKLKSICNYIKNYSIRIYVTEHELKSKLEKRPSQSTENKNNTQYWIPMRQLIISAIIYLIFCAKKQSHDSNLTNIFTLEQWHNNNLWCSPR